MSTGCYAQDTDMKEYPTQKIQDPKILVINKVANGYTVKDDKYVTVNDLRVFTTRGELFSWIAEWDCQ